VKMVKLKHYINFGRLEETIPMFPTILEGSRQMFKEIDETLKAEESEDKPLIHGDFWSGKQVLPYLTTFT
jgi:fructosamine-3-kinase